MKTSYIEINIKYQMAHIIMYNLARRLFYKS